MKNHKHYEAARKAHYNTSFDPEKRATTFCRGFDATMQELEDLSVPQEYRDRYEALVVKHLHAKARCVSSMIVGSANFPVARAEKANRAERARSEEAYDYYKKITNKAKQEAHYAANPDARPIKPGDPDALERLNAKLADAKKYHEQLKQVKALIKNGMTNADASERAGLAEPVSWHSFNIQYANKAVNDLEDKIKGLEERKVTPPKELMIGGIKVVENTEAMRLQIFFDGKPPAAMIALLKSQAFKWAPSIGAWQRQLTNNAICAFNHRILPQLNKA